MADSLHKLKVIIEGNSKGLTSSAKEATGSINALKKVMNGFIKTVQVASGMKVKSDEYKRLEKELRSAEDEASRLNKELDGLGNKYVNTQTYKDLQAELAGAQAGLDVLKQKQRESIEAGGNGLAFEKSIQSAEGRIEHLSGLLKDLETSGASIQASPEFESMAIEAEKAEEKVYALQNAIEELKASGGDLKSSFLGKGIGAISAGIGKGLSKAFEMANTAIKKTSGAFGALVHRFQSEGSKALSNPFNVGLGKVLKYAVGIGSLMKMFRLLRRSIQEGFGNLSQYSAGTRAQLDSLKDGLTTINNALASAFEPILTVIAPILNSLIDMLVDAINAVGMFFSALSGSGTYTRAVRVVSGFGDAVDSASGSLAKATKANEELKRSIMGFDQINKLEDNASGAGGSGGSGGGGGAGGSGGGGGIMFTEASINKQTSDFVEMLKDAWKNADFTEVGLLIGEKLKEALDSIPWDKIKETTRKIASSIATFLNGFFATEGLADSVGNTVAQALNTALEFAYTFVTKFNFAQFGSFVGTAINSAIKNFDFSKLSLTLTGFGTGIFNAISSAVGAVSWYDVGQKIGGAIASINWKEVLSSAGRALVTAFCALLDFSAGLFSTLMQAVRNVNWGQLASDLWQGLKEAWARICDTKALSGIDDSVLNAIGTALGVIGASLVTINGLTAVAGIITGITSAITGMVGLEASIGTFVGALNPYVAVLTALGVWAVTYAPEIKTALHDTVEGFKELPQVMADNEDFFKAEQALSEALQSVVSGIDYNGLNEMIKGWTASDTSFASVFSQISEQAKTLGYDTSELREVFVAEMTKMGISAEAQKEILGEMDGQLNNMQGKEVGVKFSFDGIKEDVVTKIRELFSGVEDKTVTLRAGVENVTKSASDEVRGIWQSIVDKTATLTGKAVNSNSATLTGFYNIWGRVVNKTATLTSKAVNANAGTFKTLYGYYGRVVTKNAVLNAYARNHNSGVLSSLVSAWGKLGNKVVSLTANISKKLFGASGGVFSNGTWKTIPQYAGGGVPIKNGDHGTIFQAGEAGAEVVGHVGGRTEVLNQSQLASVMYSAVVSGMRTVLAGSQSKDTPTEFRIYLGGREVTDYVIKDVNSRTIASGRCPIYT